MTALQMATASFAVPKSVMKTMVGRVFGFLAVSRWVPKPRQPVNENVNSTARKAIPSRLLRERMLIPPDVFGECNHGRLDARPNTVLAHRIHLAPERLSEIAPDRNLRDYNPGIEIQSRRWKRNLRGCSISRCIRASWQCTAVGFATLPGDTTVHAFLWRKGDHRPRIQDRDRLLSSV